MLLLAETAEAVAKTFLGFDSDQWVILIPSILIFLAAIFNAVKGAKKGKVLDSVVDAVEEFSSDPRHEEAGKILKKKAWDKANAAGVQLGPWGLKGEAAKAKVRKAE